jgi:hypothetical protein
MSLCLGFAAAPLQAGPAASKPTVRVGREQGLAAWAKVYSVLVHPRCLNCHTATNYPQQADDRHKHLYHVVRGANGHGVPALQCVTCHQGANAESTGVPGAPGWHLAPLSMAWQDTHDKVLSSAEVCKIVSNPARNGHLDGPGLVRHMQNAELVQWAFAPGHRRDGTARSLPPLTHQQLVAATRTWVQAGMPCPDKH